MAHPIHIGIDRRDEGGGPIRVQGFRILQVDERLAQRFPQRRRQSLSERPHVFRYRLRFGQDSDRVRRDLTLRQQTLEDGQGKRSRRHGAGRHRCRHRVVAAQIAPQVILVRRKSGFQQHVAGHPGARGGRQIAERNFPALQTGKAIHRAIGGHDDRRPESGPDAAAVGRPGKRFQTGLAALQDIGDRA